MRKKPFAHTNFLVALIGVYIFTVATVANSREEKPNIVFIMADGLGYAEIGSYGQKKIRTPNLDKLAKQGMRFTQHYAGNTVCAPSRSVLMTGKHPGHTWIRKNKSTKLLGNEPIPENAITFAELLKKQGYMTGAFGKWGLGAPMSSGDPLTQGFDRFFGYNDQNRAHNYYSAYLRDNEKYYPLNNHPPVPGRASLPWGADPLDPRSYDKFKGSDYAPDRIHEQALNFVQENKDRPFLLYYPTILPHLSLQVPDEDLKPYLELGWDETPFTGGHGYSPHLTPKAAYAAMITRMDHYFGRLLILLDELNLTDNTIVIFTSDNGTSHLKSAVDYNFFESVGPLRGKMGSLYEGGIRVPAIIRWPGWVKEGSSTDFVSGFEDWLPTIMELVGGQETVPSNVDGVSLVPLLLGRELEPRPFLYREFPSYGGQQSVRVGDWKIIRQKMGYGNLDIELYNLANDIGEKNNVAAKNYEIVNHLSAIMESQHTPSEIFPLPSVDTSQEIAKAVGFFKAPLKRLKLLAFSLADSLKAWWVSASTSEVLVERLSLREISILT
jgi:arylsulfatase A